MGSRISIPLYTSSALDTENAQGGLVARQQPEVVDPNSPGAIPTDPLSIPLPAPSADPPSIPPPILTKVILTITAEDGVVTTSTTTLNEPPSTPPPIASTPAITISTKTSTTSAPGPTKSTSSTPATSSSSTSRPTPTPTATDQPPPAPTIVANGFSKSVVIGASIGAALGTLVLVLVAILLYKRHKRKQTHAAAGLVVEDAQGVEGIGGASEKQIFGFWGGWRGRGAEEMEDTGRRELADTARAELEGGKVVHELPAVSR
ncbi:hypothetical protein BJ508DRAFT_334746 [Ascobolus immersus RN42]|uniref:Mid2 domain-containing protein n=1 Tax=Ascobolus immersus RN42 TaxID=1160509 RepID=A0A3N4HLM7_ASCIM|nr:hypothetical protein BJ508DRAFT_334746 [Ascobolus immersus RN42]